MFIELNGSLVRLRLLPAGESAKIAALAGLRIFLARIKAVFTRLELANHWLTLEGSSLARMRGCNGRVPLSGDEPELPGCL